MNTAKEPLMPDMLSFAQTTRNSVSCSSPKGLRRPAHACIIRDGEGRTQQRTMAAMLAATSRVQPGLEIKAGHWDSESYIMLYPTPPTSHQL